MPALMQVLTGSLVYSPDRHFAGTDVLRIDVQGSVQGGVSVASANITLNVQPVNDPPVVAFRSSEVHLRQGDKVWRALPPYSTTVQRTQQGGM